MNGHKLAVVDLGAVISGQFGSRQSGNMAVSKKKIRLLGMHEMEVGIVAGESDLVEDHSVKRRLLIYAPGTPHIAD